MPENTYEQGIALTVVDNIYLAMSLVIIQMALGDYGRISQEAAMGLAEAIGGVLEAEREYILSGDMFTDEEEPDDLQIQSCLPEPDDGGVR